MIVDFFRHGSGLSKGCLDYLLGEDRERDNALVLSGDVELTAHLIDSSPFAKKYTSGCLSFYEHDLSDQDKQQIMLNFEQCLFPGLDQDQYQILWVQHQDKVNQDTGETRLELNFVIPNVELSTGKRLQPFYAPVDLDRVDLFKRITNAEHRLYDPDDPNNQQLLINKKNLPKDVKDFKDQLHQRICQAVIDGKFADRQELVQWLEANEIKVTRQTQKSISIENPYEGATRPIRLNGEVYEQGFRATGEYRQEIQQRIATYRGTTSERYRANVTDYQRQLKHKSQYHSDRYPTVRREISAAHTEQLTAAREAPRAVPSLATVQIEPFKANERANPDPRTASSEQKPTETAFHVEYRTDFSSSYFAYSDFLVRSRQQKQVQRNTDPEYGNQREANASGSPEPIGGQFDVQHMPTAKQQSPTSVYSDQQERRGMAERLHDSDGVLSDDRIRNTVIENHRRTTTAITATTNAVAAATAEFRGDAKQNYPSLISTIKGNGERTERLSANTKVIVDNTDTISRARTQYSHLYRADQWQSQRDEPNYSELRGRTGENLNSTAFSLVRSSQSSAEFARNVRTIEANIVQMNERKKEMEQPQPKKSRGMDFGM
ncbi:relaxase/mobilization nuclease domain-containing protein [Acinetobacter sp. TR11]|uniref:relaxase/mobilization nuclease domain-containing protein n=1 Tax=Acinetobacter sp. TR11 TaxID=3003393 RepID=UPI0022AC6C60|nr:relaxase/mobilization nuclease domain-containing protein [Acinetobacter sp. TR11]WAU75194.1 relaxase/mobilization nuclease domain-containing protein [Acinetobacter sp. TR11]